MKEHRQIEDLLAVYRDLDDRERRRVEQHVQDCATCATRLAAFRAMDRDLAGLADPQPDERLREEFYAAMNAPSRKRRRKDQEPSLVTTFGRTTWTRKLLVPAGTLALLAVVLCFAVTFVGKQAEQTFSEVQNALTSGDASVRYSLSRDAVDEGRLSEAGYVNPGSEDTRARSFYDASGWPPAAGGTDNVNDEPYDLTFFESYGVNPFIDTEDDHFSTFAMDVDTASYTVMRRYLQDGYLPDKDAVRVEEFINYFRQDYAPPADPATAFSIHLEGAPSPFGGEKYYLLRVGLQGYQVPAEARKDASLVFVIDVSGSMAREDRLELVKRALRLLVEELRPTDSVGIVVYGSRGWVLLEPTPASERETILSAIEWLQPEGSTNAEEGLVLGYQMAAQHFTPGGINRVILCSDGVANVGHTGPESILKQMQAYADQDITLSTVGFGMGNYNDVLMEQLANDGDGNYAYVDTLPEARRVFVENLTGTLQVIARDAKVQVDFNPAVVSRYRLLGYENRDVADEDFRNDAVDAGEVGAGHSVTALYELKFHPDAQGQALALYVRYQDPDTGEVVELGQGFERADFKASLEETAPRFRLDAAVAEYAEILRHSYWAKDGDLQAVLALARQVAEELPDDADVAELVTLVARASDLWVEK